MKICFYALRDFDELPMVEKYSKEYGIDFVWTAEYPHAGNIDLAQGCDGISFTPCEVRKEWLERWRSMGVVCIANRSIGYDHVPLQVTKALGIHVCNSTYPTDCVADFAIMLILMCLRKMNQTMIRAAAQDYTLKNKMGFDLSHMTVGVIGTGHIGRVLMQHIHGFGCKLLCYDKFQSAEAAKLGQYVDLPTLFKESDIITLHLPSNPETYHMLNAEAFDQMKMGVTIVNTARGNLIDSQALIKNIYNGKVGAAGLDLLENENGLYYYNRSGDTIQNQELNILRSFPNVIVSPHVAFYVESTIANMIEKAFISVKAAVEGTANPNEIKVE